MIGRLLRRLVTRPNGRALLLLALVAAAWFSWALWPRRPLVRWTRPAGPLRRAVLAPNRRSLLTEEKGPTSFPVRLWDLATGRELIPAGEIFHDLDQHRFSADGSRLAALVAPGVAGVWDTADGRRRLTDPPDGRAAIGSFPGCLALSPDGRTLVHATAAIDRRPVVRLWDVTEARVIATLAHAWLPLAFAPDGHTLVTGFTDRYGDPTRLVLWSAADGREVGRISDETI